MKKSSKIIWGIVLVGAGLLLALNALNITDIDIFFDGWWTLFLIVPAAVGLFTEREKTGNLICLAVGVFLLLSCQNIISFSLIWKLLLPVIIVIVGLKLIFSGMFGGRGTAILTKMKTEGRSPKNGFAFFSGSEVSYTGEMFEGAELTAVFGGVECDLRGAIIENDCAINITAVFGGIDILVPENINVKVSTTSIFGGTSAKKAPKKDAPTLYINGICLFGGAEIK